MICLKLALVALYMSAWIEIGSLLCPAGALTSALYMSAWIEIVSLTTHNSILSVALYMSAWIEILGISFEKRTSKSRTLHECVD